MTQHSDNPSFLGSNQPMKTLILFTSKLCYEGMESISSNCLITGDICTNTDAKCWKSFLLIGKKRNSCEFFIINIIIWSLRFRWDFSMLCKLPINLNQSEAIFLKYVLLALLSCLLKYLARLIICKILSLLKLIWLQASAASILSQLLPWQPKEYCRRLYVWAPMEGFLWIVNANWIGWQLSCFGQLFWDVWMSHYNWGSSIFICHWRASEASETLSGLFNWESRIYIIYYGTCKFCSYNP